jgi:hypothetical protein
MKTMQRAASTAALVQAGLFLLTLIFIFGILPGQGLAGPDAFNNPTAALASAVRSPLLVLFNGLDIAFAITTVVIVLALHERIHAASPPLVRIATVAGLSAAVLLLLLGMLGVSAVAELARVYSQNPSRAETAYVAVNAVINSLRPANTFAYGWWVLLVSWSALRNNALPKGLCYLGFLFGLMGVATFALPILGFLGIIVGFIWFAWLGAVLLRT